MTKRRWILFVLPTLLLVAGCVPSRLAVRPVRYEADIRVTPDEHTLDARVTVELERLDDKRTDKPTRVDLLLHPDLEVSSLEAHGATVRTHKQRPGGFEDDSTVVPTRHRLIVENPSAQLTLTLDYSGRLYQDVSSGEKEGEVHNFAVSAHVSAEGLYLDSGGYWYPHVALPEDSDPHLGLANYSLDVEMVDGFSFVAGLEQLPFREDRLRWSSPFPLDSMVLLGGPLERATRLHDEFELNAVLAPGKEDVAADILQASAEYLDRYQTLIGPYPFKDFTVLEAFFSSGFAFPTCTQIAGSQLSQYKQYRRHGYLDHELLHNWWGNGVLVDPEDGNWCEGLATYLGNYYGFVLDGDEPGARKQRRNQSNFLSAIKPEQDKPLGTFGLEGGAGRGIGYQKASSVFHMLERKIGDEAFFAGLRKLTAERMGKYTTWTHLQEAFESESGVDLDGFFDQWVWQSGAPVLELVSAELGPDSRSLSVTLTQGPTDFTLDVPLRLHYRDSVEDVVVAIDESEDTVEVPVTANELRAVELDPDFHLFRKLKPDEIMPTSALTRRATRLLIVTPEGELTEGYQIVVKAFTRSVMGDEDEPKKGNEVVVRTTAELTPEDLEQGGVLIVGDAVRNPLLRELLERTRSPVTWSEQAFSIEGEEYAGSGQAVFLTVHHPDLPRDGVTVYHGNSPAALSNARVLGYYANSLLVFETPEGTGVESGEEHPRAEVVRRMDFEFHERIEL